MVPFRWNLLICLLLELDLSHLMRKGALVVCVSSCAATQKDHKCGSSLYCVREQQRLWQGCSNCCLTVCIYDKYLFHMSWLIYVWNLFTIGAGFCFQCQCLINVCGDAVCTSKDGDVTALIVPDSARKHSDSPSSSVSSVFKETSQPLHVQQT